jgi:hypothetical protein
VLVVEGQHLGGFKSKMQVGCFCSPGFRPGRCDVGCQAFQVGVVAGSFCSHNGERIAAVATEASLTLAWKTNWMSGGQKKRDETQRLATIPISLISVIHGSYRYKIRRIRFPLRPSRNQNCRLITQDL